jgi:hypothetical protein
MKKDLTSGQFQLISLMQTSNLTLLNKTETILLLEQIGRRD